MDYLPVFLDLAGRRVLLVGGGEVALRKAALLLEAHAVVRIVAPALHPELARLRDEGQLEHLERGFAPEQLEDTAFVIAATDHPEVNRAVAAAAHARGLFANVVDDAQAGSAILPAIVDRSPVILAISTGGHSPTLARRLRGQLEALLPERLGALAQFLGRWRERVRVALPDAGRRMRFWESVLEGKLASQVLAGEEGAAEAQMPAEFASEAQAAREAAATRGEVYLIGAGPGDPDLLTLRAQQLLQQADVVLYDRLVSERILSRARREALRVFVGKQSGRHRVTQERIHALMLEYAQRGLRVARLKGGDPFVFGRGGEEMQVLRAAGVPVTVVPGITAALGAAAAAGLSLTQRGLSQAITLVTAMGEGAEALDWRALAAPLQTVVFYMGVAQLGRIVEHLIAHGAPESRPVAIVEQATLPSQRLLVGTLATIAGEASAAGIGAPALLIVGEVAAQACQRRASVESLPP
ncbi:MAG TPA: siroheme synthase CysG [Steroidobacteraceae bacterium]|jgi:uroporphyrin-III C-methyltransferase/precorrin-2 dehydrogenase/sirohydrochlorin ferrochelatase|nr:siroheme synthase CysG [Steroidobacteraceae bacterium]